MASWRTPYRSALRDLAQALVDQAQVKSRNDQLTNQMKLQQDMVEAQSFQNLFNVAQQTTQDLTNTYMRGQEEKRLEGDRARNLAQQDLSTARDTLARLEALGADPAEIERQRALVEALTGVVGADPMQALSMYNSIMGGELVPETRTPATLLPTAPGYEGPAMQGGVTAPQGVIPGVTTPAMTGADVLTGGVGAVAALSRTAAIEDARMARLQQMILDLNPDDPTSVYQAYAAAEMIDTLPPELRESLAGPAEAAINAFNNSEEAQEIYRRRGRIDEAELERLETAAAYEREQLDYFRRTRDVEYRRLTGIVDAEFADRVVNAYNTGVIAGLDDQGREELAKIAKVSVDELDTWSQNKIAQQEERVALQDELNRLQVDQAKQSIRIGNQQIDLNDININRANWSFQREQFLAGVQDEATIAQGIASALKANDTAMLGFYMSAYDNPDSVLGQQMRAILGDDYGDTLAGYFDAASEREAIEWNILRLDEQARGIAVGNARLMLQRNQALTPYEIKALTAQYELDAAAAAADIKNLNFTDMANATQTLAQIAQALPPEWWDNVPADVQAKLDQFGLSGDTFKSISTSSEWLRESPQREQAWNLIDTMLRSGDPGMEMSQEMRDGITQAIGMMGIDDPQMVTALEQSLEGIWMMNSADIAATMASVALDAATGVTSPEDMTRIINGFTSLENNLTTEYQSTLPQRISAGNCATVIQNPLGPTLTFNVAGGWKTTPADHNGNADAASNCAALRARYDEVGRSIESANRQQAFWVQQLESYGQSGLPDTGFSPEDSVNFYNLVGLLNDPNATDEQINALYNDLVGKYGEADVDAYINQLLGNTGGQ